MKVRERSSGDRRRPGQLVRRERDARRRDRRRAVAPALDGRRTERIIEMLARSRGIGGMNCARG